MKKIVTKEEAKKYRCKYCDMRHSFCNYEPTLDECEFFVPGRCLSCAIYRDREGKKNPTKCDFAFDYEGCNNYIEYNDN